jgi:redox-sensitive bicupin YhaK (pirin superfamily)
MSHSIQPNIDIRRADTRFATDAGWLESRHCFSFSRHYDPSNTHHGLLLVSNDDIVAPRTGFDTHPHQDMEIVTWVMSGELEHKDTLGNTGLIYPGLAQRMSAGRGIWHSEKNNTSDASVHFVQMWVLPDTEGIDPGYQQLDINPELDKGGLVPIASGRGHDAAIAIRQKNAVLWGGRLKPGETVSVPDGQFVHLYVAQGGVNLENAGCLEKGDAVRLTAAGAPKLTADPLNGAEVLIWQTELPTRN